MTTLIELFPGVAQEIVHTLTAGGRTELASSVPELKVVDRCRCGDDFCAMVYTVPPPNRSWGKGHGCFQVKTHDGSIIILDVVRGRIASVEILFRVRARERLLAICP